MMNLELEKIKLVDAIIKIQDIDLLHQLRDIVNKEKSDKYSLSTEQIEILERRRTNHLNGSSKSYSWKDIKSKVAQQ